MIRVIVIVGPDKQFVRGTYGACCRPAKQASLANDTEYRGVRWGHGGAFVVLEGEGYGGGSTRLMWSSSLLSHGGHAFNPDPLLRQLRRADTLPEPVRLALEQCSGDEHVSRQIWQVVEAWVAQALQTDYQLTEYTGPTRED